MEAEELPQQRTRWIEPQALDPLSVADLGAYIAALREEIARAEAAIGAKTRQRSAAEQFFKR